MNKILLIGCGHMGSALLDSWYSKTNNSYLVVDPLRYKSLNIKYKNKVKSYKKISEIKDFKSINIVIFAIKPQIAKSVLQNFSNYKFNKNIIFVSIIAGKKIGFFKQFLPKFAKFIRVMPNLPVMVNEGMSCLVANKEITKKNKQSIESLFSKTGKIIWLRKESDINKVTAISGSGPGYIFLFIDAFEKAALNLGLGKEVTRKIIYQTLIGSTYLLINEKKEASILADNIAIKGGTTEAGLKIFKNKKILHKTLEKVIKAAYIKATQLGN